MNKDQMNAVKDFLNNGTIVVITTNTRDTMKYIGGFCKEQSSDEALVVTYCINHRTGRESVIAIGRKYIDEIKFVSKNGFVTIYENGEVHCLDEIGTIIFTDY